MSNLSSWRDGQETGQYLGRSIVPWCGNSISSSMCYLSHSAILTGGGGAEEKHLVPQGISGNISETFFLSHLGEGAGEGCY